MIHPAHPIHPSHPTLGARAGGAAPTIQITTAAYLDPALMRVGDTISDAFVSGTYPDFGGVPVIESAVVYSVDGAPVAGSYVLQAGDLVGAALVTLAAGAETRQYYAEPAEVTDFNFDTADFTFTVPAGSTVTPDAFVIGNWSIADDGTNGDATVTISALPADNGFAITDLEYRIGTGAAVSWAATTTGTYAIGGLTDGSATNVQIRARNANGPGAWSDTKSVTTTGISGPSVISSGRLINTSAPGVTPAIVGSITAQAGDLILIPLGTCRNTGGSAMTVSGTWNGQNFTEEVNVLHGGGRITGHFLALVASAGAFATPVITCSTSAAAVGADYCVIRGQSGAWKKQNDSSVANNVATLSRTLPAPAAGGLVIGLGVQQYTTAANPSTLTAQAPLGHDDGFPTGTGNNLDLVFGTGHVTAPDTSDITVRFNSDAAMNMVVVGLEVF